jgi:hypothetical protein
MLFVAAVIVAVARRPRAAAGRSANDTTDAPA